MLGRRRGHRQGRGPVVTIACRALASMCLFPASASQGPAGLTLGSPKSPCLPLFPHHLDETMLRCFASRRGAALDPGGSRSWETTLLPGDLGRDALGCHHLPPGVAGLFLIIFCFSGHFFASQLIFPPWSISSREGSPATGSTGIHAWEGWGGCDGVRRGHEPGAGGMQLGSVGTTMENEAELWSFSDCAVCAVAECLRHGGVQQPDAGSLVKRGDKAMGVTSPKAAERRQLPPARSCNRRPRRCLRAAGCVSLRED